MNNTRSPIIYILAMIVIVATGIYFCIQPIAKIKDNLSQLESVKMQHDAKKAEAAAAEQKYNMYMAQKKKEEQLRKQHEGELKKIYEPLLITTDNMGLFGSLLGDVVTIAKRSGLRVHSLEFFSNLKAEALLEGKKISLEDQLNSLGAKDTDKAADTKDASNAAPASVPVVNTSYKGYQVDFGFLGSYGSLRTFINALNDYSYLVKIKKVESYPYVKNPKILVSNVSVVLFVQVK